MSADVLSETNSGSPIAYQESTTAYYHFNKGSCYGNIALYLPEATVTLLPSKVKKDGRSR